MFVVFELFCFFFIVIFSSRAEPSWEAMLALKDESLAFAKQSWEAMSASKDESLAFAKQALKHADGRIAALNTRLMVANGLVEPRCAMIIF